MRPEVCSFFHQGSNTIAHLVWDPSTRDAAIIDSCLDYDGASGRTETSFADTLIEAVEARELRLVWILETHAHADHLSAAPHLRDHFGAPIGIGERITEVQALFKDIYNLERTFLPDGSQFDRLFADGERFHLGQLMVEVKHTHGHTPADVTYVIGDTAFVGDSLFMPDAGTARADFPGGSAETLYQSTQRILSLPGETRLFMFHDYGAGGSRDIRWETTVEEQRAKNIHVGEGMSCEKFVTLRQQRDATLGMPSLILPSIQVNIRAGHLPPAEDNGTRYLKIPLNTL
ncbi:MAG: MBL fold metallo-hydrolase [Geminicoccaceae bacterium]